MTEEDDEKDYSRVTCSGAATAPHLNLSLPVALQWEGHITCDRVRTIWLQIRVMEIVGTGDNEHSVLADFTPGVNHVTKSWDVDDQTPCEGTASTRYYTYHYGKIDGTQMTPYPAQSPTVTLQCYLST